MKSSVTLSFDVGELRLNVVVSDISDSILAQPIEWLTESPMVLLVDVYQVVHRTLNDADAVEDSVRHISQTTYVVKRDADDLKTWARHLAHRMFRSQIEKGVFL